MDSRALLWPALGGAVGLVHAISMALTVGKLQPESRGISMLRAMVGYVGRLVLVGLVLAVAACQDGGRGVLLVFAGLWVTRWLVVGFWLGVWRRSSVA